MTVRITHRFTDKYNRRLSRNEIARREILPAGAVRFITGENSTAEQRAMIQLELWRRGHPVHNDIDNMCCPDFSCCRGKQHMANDRLREMFYADPASRGPMMQFFISELPDEMRVMYDLPGQAVFRLEPKQ